MPTASLCLTDIFRPNALRKAQDVIPRTVPLDLLQLHDGTRHGLNPRVKANINFTSTVFLVDGRVLSLRKEFGHTLRDTLNVVPKVVG